MTSRFGSRRVARDVIRIYFDDNHLREIDTAHENIRTVRCIKGTHLQHHCRRDGRCRSRKHCTNAQYTRKIQRRVVFFNPLYQYLFI